MKYLRIVANKFRMVMFVYVLMGLMQAFLQSFSSRYFQTVIDNFTNHTLTALNIGIYAGAMILLYITCYLDEYPGRKLEHGLALAFKAEALKKVSVIDYLSYVKLGTGTLIQRIDSGANAGRGILYNFWLRLSADLLPNMIFSIIFIFAINRTVMLSILIGYVFVFVITNLLLKILYKVKQNILVNEEKLNHFLVRGFMEMVVFRVNRRFKYEIEKIDSASGEIVSSKIKMTLIHEAFFTIFAILVALVKMGIIIYGWRTGALTIGEIVALIALVDNAYVPIAIFNVIYVDYKLDKVAYARYAEFLDAPEDIHIEQGNVAPERFGDIALRDVDFRYEGRGIFDHLNLTIAQGKSTALVGESGSGKSTAVKLIVGLLHPSGGEIQIGGSDLSAMRLNDYYAHIAYLPQEPPVFDGSLRENLVFDDAVADRELIDALRGVGLGKLFAQLEQGLDTQLGERGITLSGGERQQLALARLWFSKAQLIIFDEATSSIDNLSEQAVMQRVMQKLSGKTVIAIAHRLDSIKDFDRIVMFNRGNVVEQGDFEALMAKQSQFYELYNRVEA